MNTKINQPTPTELAASVREARELLADTKAAAANGDGHTLQFAAALDLLADHVVQLEQSNAELRRRLGSHDRHLPDPPRHVGAFDTMKGALPRQPAAGEVLPPERRATPWRKPIAGVDK